MRQQLNQKFFSLYQIQENQPLKYYFSPGRVNLIGEHTDYNGGQVFPCAINSGTYMVIQKTNDSQCRFASTNFKESTTIPLQQLNQPDIPKQENADLQWINYILGVIQEFKQYQIELSGFQLLIHGNLPIGTGLSSSASLEVLMAFVLNDLFEINGAKLNNQELALLGQRAERNYVGVSCGIMDQYAVAMGQKNHAMALKCDTLECQQVKIELQDYALIVSNTNKVRGLADSKYNERVQECQQALEIINSTRQQKVSNLCQLSVEEFQQLDKNIFSNEVIYRRARHVISENQRVTQALQALQQGNNQEFGNLLNQSHTSLKSDYEVTGAELDALAESAQIQPGVLGSRMTGAGFGGCTVSLVKKFQIDNFKKNVGKMYTEKTGLKADFYTFSIEEGVNELRKPQIVVTGGTGYIGSHTVVELIETGYEAIIIDSLDNSCEDVLDGIEKITGVRPAFEKVDLKDRQATFQVFEKYNNIQGIIHFAAYKAIGESFQNPLKYYTNNINSLLHIQEAMQKYSVNNIIFSSSCAVYGKFENLPVTEESPFLPAESPYGNTKQMGEQMLHNLVRSDQTKSAIALRYFNPIGGHPSYEIGELPIGVPLNLVPYITQTAVGIREQLTIFGNDYETSDGTCVRDYLHVVDLAKAHIISLNRLLNNEQERSYEYFNLGKGKGYSVLEIIQTFEKVNNIKINCKIGPRRQGDVPAIWADPSFANKVLKWEAKLSLEEMLQSSWKWEQKYRSKQTLQQQ